MNFNIAPNVASRGDGKGTLTVGGIRKSKSGNSKRNSKNGMKIPKYQTPACSSGFDTKQVSRRRAVRRNKGGKSSNAGSNHGVKRNGNSLTQNDIDMATVNPIAFPPKKRVRRTESSNPTMKIVSQGQQQGKCKKNKKSKGKKSQTAVKRRKKCFAPRIEPSNISSYYARTGRKVATRRNGRNGVNSQPTDFVTKSKK